ncbi:LCP family protein [Tepidibacillus marianensis]|uniref:LCP family protein n=1 Tax=Tepidibacillus marianensis TaxID=3131995 RepID=UPI0030CB0A45
MIGTGVYSFYRINNTIDKIYHPVERVETNVKDDGNAGSKAYLLLGIDRDSTKTNDLGRTDVIMIAIVNDKTKKVTLTSIPRDTYVEIAGKNYKDKINAAYQYGVANTIATVENFTNIHIDNYILTNYDGIYRAIKVMGGIRLYVDKDLSKFVRREIPYLKYPDEGYHVLNADQALYYARFRHDINGDFGRNNRQQAFIKGFIDQSTEIRSPLKISQFLDALGGGIETDLTKSQIVSLAKQFSNYSSQNIESIHYKGIPARFGPQDLWYVLIKDQERERVTNLLKERLNADKNTVLTDPAAGIDTKEPSEAEINELIREQTGSTTSSKSKKSSLN